MGFTSSAPPPPPPAPVYYYPPAPVAAPEPEPEEPVAEKRDSLVLDRKRRGPGNQKRFPSSLTSNSLSQTTLLGG